MKISLKQLCGEFCTERGNPGLQELIRFTIEAIEKNQHLELDRTGVLILSISFINEFTSRIADRFSLQDFEKAVSFSPLLEELYLYQIKRQFELKKK